MADTNNPSSTPAPSVESIDAEIQNLRRPIEGMLDSTRLGKLDAAYKVKSQLLAGTPDEPEGVKNFRREHGKPAPGKPSPAPRPLWQQDEPESDNEPPDEAAAPDEVRSHFANSWGPRFEENAEALANAAEEVFQANGEKFANFVEQLPPDAQVAAGSLAIEALRLPPADDEAMETAGEQAAERLEQLWGENAAENHEAARQTAIKIFGSEQAAEQFINQRNLSADAQVQLWRALLEIARAKGR
jgi:hypothetical protein